MKRFILLLTGIVFFGGILFAQDPLTLSWDGEPIGDTLNVYGEQYDFELVAHAVVTNNTSESMGVKVRRQRLVMQEGTVSLFCWGLCFPPPTEESPDPRVIGAGESSADEEFSGHYLPKNIFGTSIVEYEFFNMNDESINVKMVVKYNATAIGIGDKAKIEIAMFPNPTSGRLSIESEVSIKQIVVFDLSGKNVFSLKPDKNKLQINLGFLTSGIYLISIETENGTRTQKLTIR